MGRCHSARWIGRWKPARLVDRYERHSAAKRRLLPRSGAKSLLPPPEVAPLARIVSDQDWFRNTEWNELIERAFEDKLRRSRRKSQYLRIQAHTLAESHPVVALQLLERYFELEDKFDCAQAYCDQATAFLSLGRPEDAVICYEKALRREAEFPNLETQAYLELPFLIATRRLRDRFDQAEQILRDHQSRLTFPVDRFMWHSSWALIATSRGDGARASEHASQALIEAQQRHSGMQFHPAIGLVSQRHQSLVDDLARLVGRPFH